MKTLEVLERVKTGKRVSQKTNEYYDLTFKSINEFTTEWFTEVSQVYEWVASIKGYSDASIHAMFGYAKSAGSYLEEISGLDANGNYLIPNIFDKVKSRPKPSHKPRRYFSANQVMDIIASCREGYDRELILTLVDSTCRIGELVGLTGGKVETETETIHVKGKTGYRNYRLDARICIALKGLAGSDTGYVFKDTDGNMASVGALKMRVNRIIRRAGMTGEKLGPHTLRHSDGSAVAKFTKSALAVKALLGHDKIDTSMEYIHDVEDEIKRDLSPLKIIAGQADNGIGHEVEIEPRQIGMTEGAGVGTELVLTEPEIVEGKPDYANDIFPEVLDGVSVRPLLKTDDLRLLRRIFVEYARQDGNHQDMMRARELMKRITRRTR